MARTTTFLRQFALAALSCFAVAATVGASTAQASDYWGGAGHYGRHQSRGINGYRGGLHSAPRSGRSHYQAPSLHYDRTFHADSLHWTPRRGLHNHGHYDYTPHFTPRPFHH